MNIEIEVKVLTARLADSKFPSYGKDYAGVIQLSSGEWTSPRFVVSLGGACSDAHIGTFPMNRDQLAKAKLLAEFMLSCPIFSGGEINAAIRPYFGHLVSTEEFVALLAESRRE